MPVSKQLTKYYSGVPVIATIVLPCSETTESSETTDLYNYGVWINLFAFRNGSRNRIVLLSAKNEPIS